MSTTRSRRTTTRICTGLIAFASMVGLAACGSDSESSSTAAATTTPAAGATTTPEEHIADDAEVTAGLGKMVATATAISTSVAGGAKVDDAGEQLEANWSVVEGTVKSKEPETYLDIEDGMTALDIEDGMTALDTAGKAGDATATAKAAADLGTAITGYLAKHP